MALGEVAAGLFSNDDALVCSVQAAATAVNERVWRLPILPEHTADLAGSTSDLKSTGGRMGGSRCATIQCEFASLYPCVCVCMCVCVCDSTARTCGWLGGHAMTVVWVRMIERRGSIAAAFLQKFVEPGVKWAHLDIAGELPAWRLRLQRACVVGVGAGCY